MIYLKKKLNTLEKTFQIFYLIALTLKVPNSLVKATLVLGENVLMEFCVKQVRSNQSFIFLLNENFIVLVKMNLLKSRVSEICVNQIHLNKELVLFRDVTTENF